MENASKALIMAGGVLIGILLISLAVYLFVDFGTTSAKINEKNAQQQIVEFNSKFTSYEEKSDLTIYDVITVLGYAQENNTYYENSKEYKVDVILDNISILHWTEDIKTNKIKEEIKNNIQLPIYKCVIGENAYHNSGRLKNIQFIKNP